MFEDGEEEVEGQIYKTDKRNVIPDQTMVWLYS
jgi:hypothetical protein